MKQFLL